MFEEEQQLETPALLGEEAFLLLLHLGELLLAEERANALHELVNRGADAWDWKVRKAALVRVHVLLRQPAEEQHEATPDLCTDVSDLGRGVKPAVVVEKAA